MNTNAVSSRVLGQFPLSIGTSIALETALGINEDKPEQTKKLLLDYQVIWVNLKTLFRNFYEAISRDEVLSVNPQDLYDAFVSEVDQFERIIASETNQGMRVVWYVSDYANMKSTYPHAILRGDVTSLQKAYSAAMVSTIGPYLRYHPHKAKKYSLKIHAEEPAKALLMTHYPIDLFSRGFRSMCLFESHTGAIKPKHLWYTKYYKGTSLSQIPFREDFIQVFGDKEHFHPFSISIRKQILGLADKYNWSYLTTDAKISYGIDQLKDPMLKDILRSLR